MPRLIRGVARTAVVAGTATAVSNNVSRRQANRWAQQQAATAPPPQYQQATAPPPPPAATGTDDVIAEPDKLGQLRDSSVLTPRMRRGQGLDSPPLPGRLTYLTFHLSSRAVTAAREIGLRQLQGKAMSRM